MINKSNISKAGFTLMETLVAVLVLSLAITGPLAIAQKGLQAALISKDQISAFYLAQDAIEYIRYARDTNCLAAGSSAGGCPVGQWLVGNNNATQSINLVACVGTVGTNACTTDSIAASAPIACVSGICAPIKYDASHNYYTYGSGSASIFTRAVTITTPVCNGSTCNASEAQVSVKVTWSDPIPHTVTVKEDILDWQ